MTAKKKAVVAPKMPQGIIILGAAKSGTTALFYAIQNTLLKRHGLTVKGLFEPTEGRRIKQYLESGGDDIPLIKMLLGPFIRKEIGFFEKFDKKIIIYRDPRDNVVSRLVFMLTKLIDLSDHDKIEEVMKLLRRKEQDPESLSIVSIIREISRISGREQLLSSVRNNALLPAKMKREAGGEYFMLPYEQFVAAQFDEMNRYLGFDVDPDFQVGERHNYVVRTKAAGSWKDWFLKEDVDYFVKEVADDYRELGFDIDQEPNAVKSIDPKICSEYALAQFTRLREKRAERKEERRLQSDASAGKPEKPEQKKLKDKSSKKKAAPTGKAKDVETVEEKKARRQKRKAKRRAARGAKDEDKDA